MTSNYIAKVVESLYNKVDIDKMSEGFDKLKKYEDCGRVSDEWVNRRITEKSYFRWCQSINVLEQHLIDNYTTFEETELVYKWGKKICERRNKEFNEFRSTPTHNTFEEWLNLKYR